MRRFLCLGLAFFMLAAPASVRAERPHTILAATPISRTDLSWWRTRHEAKLKELRARQPALIFLGDSITEDWEYSGPAPWLNFAPVWQRFYGGRNAVNLGFKGDTTASLLWRIENGETAGIAPKAAVILIGANNLGRLHWSAGDTVAGIDAIVRALRQRLPGTRLLLLGILPSERNAWATETTLAVNKALAARYQAGGEVTFLDVGHVFMKGGKLDRDLFYDPKKTPPDPPLHPSPEGQALMAAAMEPTLAAMLGDRPGK
jgi:lysophospholipase L1-like esterase